MDVLIVGGTTAGVAAAISARRGGARVFLAAPRTYLGEDLCATLRLELREGDAARTELGRRLFDARGRCTPLRVKKTLETALLEAGVAFRFGCLPLEAIRNTAGALCGLVLATRGAQLVMRAKSVIDASEQAGAARLAGARFQRRCDGPIAFERTVILPGEPPQSVTHRVDLPLPGGGYRALAEAEQQARDRTYTPGQLRASESLFAVPPSPIVGQTQAERWTDEASGDPGHFKPAGVERLYVLSGWADIPRGAAAELMRPAGLLGLGAWMGRRAADEARRLPAPTDATHSGAAPPTWGRWDVVVVGGGTSGVAAAIAAGRRGRRVLLVEYQEGLGGTGTVGLIGKPYHGRRVGFAAEVPFPDAKHNAEHKMEWLRRAARTAGVEIWLGALGHALVLEGKRVVGVVVGSPHGPGVARARVVIDATGSAELPLAAGARGLWGGTEDGDIALQGAGLPLRPLGRDYVNTDYLLVDETDPTDAWGALVGARLAMDEGVFDVGPQLQTRERRRVAGEHVLSYLDQIAGRTYADSIVLSASDYDSHGYPNELYFALIPHDERTRRLNHPAPGGASYTPYRCLLARGLDGLLVIGLGMSMRRDASAMVRMQYDLLNQGYAAGVAAAMSVEADTSVRRIDVRALQRHLVDTGALPGDVLEHRDNFPLDGAAVERAARELTHPDRDTACRALAVVLSHAQAARGALQTAFDAADGNNRLVYAKVLGALGDGRGVPEMIAALDSAEWDEKIPQGRMAEYAHLPTPVDALVIALGRTRDPRAIDPILAKLDRLDAASPLSHHRAAAGALERLGDARAVGPLGDLLARPGMMGHAMIAPEPLYDRPVERRRREGALREIVLARALVRCGDHEGLGRRILETYTRDLRRLLVDHARFVLGRRDGS